MLIVSRWQSSLLLALCFCLEPLGPMMAPGTIEICLSSPLIWESGEAEHTLFKSPHTVVSYPESWALLFVCQESQGLQKSQVRQECSLI